MNSLRYSNTIPYYTLNLNIRFPLSIEPRSNTAFNLDPSAVALSITYLNSLNDLCASIRADVASRIQNCISEPSLTLGMDIEPFIGSNWNGFCP